MRNAKTHPPCPLGEGPLRCWKRPKTLLRFETVNILENKEYQLTWLLKCSLF